LEPKTFFKSNVSAWCKNINDPWLEKDALLSSFSCRTTVMAVVAEAGLSKHEHPRSIAGRNNHGDIHSTAFCQSRVQAFTPRP
jgi:hypothetical protein